MKKEACGKTDRIRKTRNEKKRLFLRRRQRKTLKRQRFWDKPRKQKKAVPKIAESRLISCLRDRGFAIPPEEIAEKKEMTVPEYFSMTGDPSGTIFFLRELFGILMCPEVKQVYFDHSRCKYIGICASAIMDILLVECKKWRHLQHNDITYSGKLLRGRKISEDPEVDTLLKASGILKHLDITHQEFKDIECLELLKDEHSSDIAEKTIDYINRSLYRHGMHLTAKGENYFGKMLGEIADNCRQHGGEQVTWYAQGHYSYNPYTREGKCLLVIADFGDTIYEGLKNSQVPVLKKQIRKYVGRARTYFPIKESEETLYTLFSLQQRVSRFAAKKGVVRGNGTAVFLDSFQRLFSRSGQGKSKLSITSGKCSILFDGTYLLHDVHYGERYTNKIIAFNRENDLKKAPDRKYVRSIEHSFPGTVIAMELYINKSLIEKKETAHGQKNRYQQI